MDGIYKTMMNKERLKTSNNFTQILNWVLTTTLFDIYEKAIIINLNMHQMNKSYSYPRIETIARETRMSQTKVKTTIKKLKAIEATQITKRGRKNIYTLNSSLVVRRLYNKSHDASAGAVR